MNQPQPMPPSPIGVNAQYIKDFSFESPNAPQIFAPTQTPPELNMGVNVRTRPLTTTTNAPDTKPHEVLLMLRLETKLEGKTAFIAELTYGGIFTLPNAPEEQLKVLL